MAQIPVNLRPKYLIRRKAMRHGLLGPSRFWRLVGLLIAGSNTIQKTFGKSPERLARRRIGIGHAITVATYAPLTRKQRRSLGISKASLEADARAELKAAQRAS